MAETGNGSRTKSGTKAKGQAAPSRPKSAAEPTSPERGPICTVAFCPICMAVTAGQGAAPDVFEHLLAAAREFFLAARAVIDVRGDHVSGVDQSSNGSKDFERIEIS